MLSLIGGFLIAALAAAICRGAIDAGALGEFLRSLPGWAQVGVSAFSIGIWLFLTESLGGDS